MKRVVATLVMFLVLVIGVQADSKEDFLRESFEQLLDSDPGVDRDLEREATIYLADIPYYAATANGWWTGLAVSTFEAATFNIGVWDANGVKKASGSFSINKNAQKIDQLYKFVTSKSVPSTGSVQISSSKHFKVTVFIGNPTGGFGFAYIDSVAIQQ